VPSPSYGACVLSIWLLFNREEQGTLEGIDPGKSPVRVRRAPWCHLWTFTFPDNVSPEVALERWAPLSQNLYKAGKRCVRVVERGNKGERRWHIHAVTPQRWSLQWLRPLAEAHGFGRINVKRIPAERAHYIVKYLGKQFEYEFEGRKPRLWSCVGFEGAVVSNVRMLNEIDRRGMSYDNSLIDAEEWSINGVPSFSLIHRGKHARPTTEAIVIKKMEFKKTQAEELLKDLAQGHCLIVGEYRGFNVREVGVADKRSGVRVTRVVVEHNVEISGMSRNVAEWLPVGADKNSVKPAATRGEMVKVTVESAKWFGGSLTIGGVIKPLNQIL